TRRAAAREAAVASAEAAGGPVYRALREKALYLWYEMVEQRLRRTLIDSSLRHAREVLRIVRVRRTTGDIDSLESISAELVLAQTRADSIEAAGDLRAAEVAAAVAAGLPERTRIDPVEDVT